VITGGQTYIDQQTKHDKPEDRDEEVKGIVGKGARPGEQPDEGEEDGEGGDDLGVDEAGEGPRVLKARPVHVMQVAAVDAGDDGGKGELCGAQDGTAKLKNGHGSGCSCDVDVIVVVVGG